MPVQKIGGRPPTRFNPDLMDDILDKLSKGGTLSKICEASGMPSTTTVYKWLREQSGLREKWEIAKELKSHSLIDEALDISRTLQHKLDTQGKVKDGHEITLNMSRAADIRIKALMDMAGRLNPKAYGPRNQAANVIPIQIITNMNLGQEGPAVNTNSENIYHVTAPARKIIDVGNDTDN